MNDPSWLRLQSVFDAAIALAPAEWESYLTTECGDDTALRAQVEALIATYPADDDRRVRNRERLRVLAERSGRQELAIAEGPAG